MREIKFRAWTGKEMHQIGDLQNIASMGDWRVIDKYEAVMQYTGLHDKDGKEIYEDDLILLYGRNKWDKEEAPVQVLWDEQIAGFGFKNQDMATHLNFRKLAAEHYEVIGNIYENPELLQILRQQHKKDED